jgi:alkylation response protein AidB-like acyl-CoA dehydrogenase
MIEAKMYEFQDDEVFLKTVRTFVANEVLPNTRAWEADAAFPAEIWPRLGELGLLGIMWPKEHGGLGMSCRTFCETIREIAKGDPALAMNLSAMNTLAIGHFRKFASKTQVDAYIPGILTGEIKLAWALTEPDAGSDARRVKTTATPTEDRPGYFHINGRKMFITNGGKADLIVLIARTSDQELSAFLVETAQPGFKIEKRIETVGVSASNTVQFSLSDVVGWHTPCKFEDALALLYPGRLGIAAMALGIGEKALELTLQYAKEREQFNRRLTDMQSVQNMLADCAVELEASRLLTMNGADLFDSGKPVIKESSFAKLFASETANRVTNHAIQIHGGRGMTKEFLVEKLWRDAKLTEIGEGCSEIQRLVIAKAILK